MTWDGHLARQGEIGCKDCNKPLNNKGHYPAETYAGTASGICYGCTSKPGYAIRTEFDGAVLWSHPPYQPCGFERRQDHYGYPGCEECGGDGSVIARRAFHSGGSYRSYCKTCSTRRSKHPLRQWKYKRTTWIHRASEEVFRKLVKLLEGRCESDDPEVEEFRDRVIERYGRSQRRLDAMFAKRAGASWEPGFPRDTSTTTTTTITTRRAP